jgi:hypothetical protein
MATTAALDAALKAIYSNGVGEAGLEVGSDPGLPAEAYVQVPEGFRRGWAVRMTQTEFEKLQTDIVYIPLVGDAVTDEAKAAHKAAWISSHVFETVYEPTEGDRIGDLAGKNGWITGGKVLAHDGSIWVKATRLLADGTTWTSDWLVTDDWYFPRYTTADIRAFLTVNDGHIRDAGLTAEDKNWIHAVRFWGLTSGFVFTDKNTEWKIVPDPAAAALLTGDAVDETIAYIAGFAAHGHTAASARAASWRKTGHCTGGTMATGYVYRWLEKMSFFKPDADKLVNRNNLRDATTCFYTATHALSVHAILALMAPEDTYHWAVIDPAYGLIPEWDIGESARVRMAPKTQVAGAAVVVDAMVVLKMTIKEGIAPLIGDIGDAAALVSAFHEVETYGIACSPSAKWFLADHPTGLGPHPFQQKDASFSALAGELAIIGTKYYASHTIAKSPALQNAANQLGDEVARAGWSALAAQKTRISGAQLIEAVARIKGATTGGTVAAILSNTRTEVDIGVTRYNAKIDELAALVRSTPGTKLNPDKIWADRPIAPAAPPTA